MAKSSWSGGPMMAVGSLLQAREQNKIFKMKKCPPIWPKHQKRDVQVHDVFWQPCCQYNQVIKTNKICANLSSQGKKRFDLCDLWVPSNKRSKTHGIFESPCSFPRKQLLFQWTRRRRSLSRAKKSPTVLLFPFSLCFRESRGNFSFPCPVTCLGAVNNYLPKGCPIG